jgi:hypothetical protein
MFDIKLTRPTVQSIIAGPFKTKVEAEEQAKIYREQDGQARMVKAKEKGSKKFLAETVTKYEVVPHVRGGIK